MPGPTTRPPEAAPIPFAGFARGRPRRGRTPGPDPEAAPPPPAVRPAGDRRAEAAAALFAALERRRPALAREALLVAARGIGADRVRHNGDPLERLAPEPAAQGPFAALARLFGAGRPASAYFGCGGGVVALAPGAETAVRVRPALARSAAEVRVERVGFALSARFPGGARMLFTGPEGAQARLVFPDMTTTLIAPAARRR